MKIPLVLLCGGLATRLGDCARTVPKSLIEVAGEPFIFHQLRLLKREKIGRVVICAGHLGDQIQKEIQNGSQFGLDIGYSFDGEKLLGTGGAIKQALPLLSDVFWVMYGDSYLDTTFSPILNFFFAHQKKSLITIFKNENKWERSNIDWNGKEILKYNKKHPDPSMKYVDCGLGIMRKSAFSPWLDRMTFDLSDLQEDLVQEHEMLGHEVHQRFFEVGSIKGLEETRQYIEKNRILR